MIIVNFATNHFLKGQRRLEESINGSAKFLGFADYQKIKSPTHNDSPYQFKIHAIEKAWEQDDIVLWLDASVWVVGDISIVENIIKEEGYFFSEAGHYTGRWCNDHTKKYFNVTEQEMVQGPGGMTLFSAGLLGLNKNNELAMQFFKEWKASALAGCFRGDHSNHRHDQTCASIIAQRLGMKYQRGGKHLAYIGEGYSKPEKDVVFFLQGII